MDYLLYFLAGIVFSQYLMPIGDSIANLIISFIEMLKGKIGLNIARYNVAIQKLSEEPEVARHVIGFQVPSSSDEWEEEDDE